MKHSSIRSWVYVTAMLMLFSGLIAGAFFATPSHQHMNACKAKSTYCHFRPSLQNLLP
ncbi:hypothetical protein SAMN05216264_11473 [Pseudomonas marincola]|nr:hypothetical protein SAMN05216264_11473 [Pseudomonas marincola]